MERATSGAYARWSQRPVWIAAATPIVLCMLLLYVSPVRLPGFLIAAFAVLALAPFSVLLITSRREVTLGLGASMALEETEKLKLELDTVRYRTVRLREELAAADSQARQSHQLTLLGRFTAGFLHEFNNPLAILTSRIEVLLEERKDDRALCVDLNQLLKEARYMANISGTLLPALRRERGSQKFSPCGPADVLKEIVASLGSAAETRGVKLVLEPAEVSPVNLRNACARWFRTLWTRSTREGMRLSGCESKRITVQARVSCSELRTTAPAFPMNYENICSSRLRHAAQDASGSA